MITRAQLRGWWRRLTRADRKAAAKVLAHQHAQGPATIAVAEHSAFTHGRWTLIGGDGAGWEGGAFYKVRGLAWQGERLYASLTGPLSDGPRGEVWSWDRRTWRREKHEWGSTASFVEHLFSFHGSLYAAERGAVWKLHDGRWTSTGGELCEPGKSGGYAFAEWQGRLVMSFWGKPAVAVLYGERWSFLPDPGEGWGANVRTVYCLHQCGSFLYAGTGTGRFAGPASSVWRFDGRNWEKIGGDGIRGSWIEPGIPFVLSLNTYGGMLIATLSRPPGTHPHTSNVWAFDGARWRAIGTGKVPLLMGQSLIANDTAVFGGRFVAATGDGFHRDAQIWELEPDQSWRPAGAENFSVPVSDAPGGYWIYRLCAADNALFAGTAGHRGGARVFRFADS